MHALETYVFTHLLRLRSRASSTVFQGRVDAVHVPMLCTIVTFLWRAQAQRRTSAPNQPCYSCTHRFESVDMLAVQLFFESGEDGNLGTGAPANVRSRRDAIAYVVFSAVLTRASLDICPHLFRVASCLGTVRVVLSCLFKCPSNFSG